MYVYVSVHVDVDVDVIVCPVLNRVYTVYFD